MNINQKYFKVKGQNQKSKLLFYKYSKKIFNCLVLSVRNHPLKIYKQHRKIEKLGVDYNPFWKHVRLLVNKNIAPGIQNLRQFYAHNPQ